MGRNMWSTVVVLGLNAGLSAVPVRTFDEDALDAQPPGFVFQSVGGAVGRWLVRGEQGNRYLTYAPQSVRTGQAVALLDTPVAANFRTSVRLRLGDGVKEAGLVWRYVDADNYSQATLDLAKQELALYRVVSGTRVKIEDEDDLELDPSAWHVMTVRQDRERVRIYLGGISVLRSRTRTADTVGRVGVWSSSATTADFDDLRLDDEAERGR